MSRSARYSATTTFGEEMNMTIVRAMLVAVCGSFSFSVSALPPGTYALDAGVGCQFPLTLVVNGGPQVFREFKDKNGNVVRTIEAGKGSTLTFINADTKASLSVRPNGSVSRTTINPDGSSTVVASGHNGLILFPTDVPAGPSTTLYVGRVVYTVDTAGVFTLEGTSGKSTDVCAVLSS
jgi:hypothetical protein